jgi:hypothetical protein
MFRADDSYVSYVCWNQPLGQKVINIHRVETGEFMRSYALDDVFGVEGCFVHSILDTRLNNDGHLYVVGKPYLIGRIDIEHSMTITNTLGLATVCHMMTNKSLAPLKDCGSEVDYFGLDKMDKKQLIEYYTESKCLQKS